MMSTWPSRKDCRLTADTTGSEPAPELAEEAMRLIESIRSGEVVTYGGVAALVGHPGAARMVGRLLARDGGVLPRSRVVHADGRLLEGHGSAAAAAGEREETRLRDVGGLPRVDLDRARRLLLRRPATSVKDCELSIGVTEGQEGVP